MLKPGTPTTTIWTQALGAVTATQTTPSAAPYIHSGNYSNAVAFLNVTAHSGTTPTLDVKFQDSPDGVIWTDVPSGAFTQVTTTNSATRLALSSVGPFLRVVQTLGGTTPSYTYDLKVSGIN